MSSHTVIEDVIPIAPRDRMRSVADSPFIQVKTSDSPARG